MSWPYQAMRVLPEYLFRTGAGKRPPISRRSVADAVVVLSLLGSRLDTVSELETGRTTFHSALSKRIVIVATRLQAVYLDARPVSLACSVVE